MPYKDPEKRRARNRAWYQENLERERARSRDSYQKHIDTDRDKKRERAAQERAEHPERQRARSRKHYASHIDQERARIKRYREENPDVQRQWLANNRDKSRAYTAKWRAAHPEYSWASDHPEEHRAYTAQWRASNPDKSHEMGARRRARKRGALVCETVNRLVVAERDGWICQLCGEPIDPMAPRRDPVMNRNNPWYLHIDHIVPLSKGGAHSYANCQAAHARCNLKKHTKV